MNRGAHFWTVAATLCCLAAVLGFGGALDGYSQVHHPLGLLGGKGIPDALAFNLLGFVVPGVLAAAAISTLRTRLAGVPGWGMRIGVQLLVLSAIAFSAQGVAPLDPADLDAPMSRYHALAWTLWWIASVAGSLLLAWSIRLYRRWRTLALASLLAAALVLTCALLAPGTLPAGIVERIAFASWFGWLLLSTLATRGSSMSPLGGNEG